MSVLEILGRNDYVLINDIESFEMWLEFRKSDNVIYISEATADKVGAGGSIRTEALTSIKYPYWKNKKVSWTEFKIEILKKAELYMNELLTRNSADNTKVMELNKFISKLK